MKFRSFCATWVALVSVFLGACQLPADAKPKPSADVLLYGGDGAEPTGLQNLQNLLAEWGYGQRTVTSQQISEMTLDDLSKFRLIIFPGGDSNVMNASMTANVRENIRRAVVEKGVSYAGFCAGAWMAFAPVTPASGGWGLGLVKAGYLTQYYPGGLNPTAAMLDISFSNGSARDLIWWGGPYLPELSAGVVGRYADGVPAIGEAWAGAGLVVVTGPHPEAPQSWRTAQNLIDSDGLDYDIALQLVKAAIEKIPLAVF